MLARTPNLLPFEPRHTSALYAVIVNESAQDLTRPFADGVSKTAFSGALGVIWISEARVLPAGRHDFNSVGMAPLRSLMVPAIAEIKAPRCPKQPAEKPSGKAIARACSHDLTKASNRPPRRTL